MTRRMLALIAAMGWLFFYLPAAAQSPAACADRATAIGHLGTKYGETAAAAGLASNGGVVELLVSPDGATWSILITTPNGVTCLIAEGESWYAVSSPKPGKGA